MIYIYIRIYIYDIYIYIYMYIYPGLMVDSKNLLEETSLFFFNGSLPGRWCHENLRLLGPRGLANMALALSRVPGLAGEDANAHQLHGRFKG